jgi:hypothetical protein
MDPKIASRKTTVSAHRPDCPAVRAREEVPEPTDDSEAARLLGRPSSKTVESKAPAAARVSPTATRLAPDYLPIDTRPFSDEEHLAQFHHRLARLVVDGKITPHYRVLSPEPAPPLPTVDRAQDGTWSADAPFTPMPEWSFLHRPGDLVPEAHPEAKQHPIPELGPYLRDAREPIGQGRVMREEDLQYLRNFVSNASAMVRDVLIPQLEDGSLFRDYAESLREQHCELTPNYGGHSMGRNSYPDAGVFIFERGRRYLFPLGRHFWSIGLLEDNQGHPATRAVYAHFKERRVELSGLPEEAWAGYQTNAVGLAFVVPPVEQMPAVLARMGELLRLTFESLDRPEGLTHLSDYLHTCCCTHLFHRANFSLFMTQVNFVLERMGLKPIAHGYLDYAAMCLGYEEFRELFTSAVAAQNPTLPQDRRRVPARTRRPRPPAPDSGSCTR